MEQDLIDGSKKVKQLVDEYSKEIGTPVTVKAFTRLARGEGIDKKESDLSTEVNQLLGK